MPLNTLALATDLSERSDRALDRAVLLANRHGCRLVLLHVVDDSFPDALMEQHRQAAEETLRATVAGHPGTTGLDLSISVVAGDPCVELVAEAGRLGADLLVSGMHRKDTLRDFVSGTTIGRVIRSSGCPVLLVRNRAAKPYAEIAVAADFSPASRHALDAAIAVAPSATFHLVHAFDVPYGGLLDTPDTRLSLREENMQRLRALIAGMTDSSGEPLRAAPAFAEPLVRQGAVSEVLRNEAGALKADLLAIGTHGRSGFGRILLGSAAESMVADPPTDLLIARAW